LFLLYHFTKQQLQDQIDEKSKNDNLWHRILRKPEVLSNKYLLVAFAVIAIIFSAFPWTATIYALVR
jgi:hypothetical protein